MATSNIPGLFSQALMTLSANLTRNHDLLENLASSDQLEAFLPIVSQALKEAHRDMSDALAGASPEIYREAQLAYRTSLTEFFKQAAIVQRCILVPRGYHGDYMTMEMMYRNGYEGTSHLGQCIHHHVTLDRSCSSVRARRNHLREQLKTIGKSVQPRTILSLACGPARELADVLTEKGVEFRRIVLLDQDDEALNFACKRIRPLLPASCDLVALNLPVQQLLFRSQLGEFLGRPDYVYSAGLFDYLPTSFASRLVAKLCEILPPHGCLEFGNFAEWPIAFFADMASGWRLILRQEIDMRELVPQGLWHELIRVEDQIFVSITK